MKALQPGIYGACLAIAAAALVLIGSVVLSPEYRSFPRSHRAGTRATWSFMTFGAGMMTGGIRSHLLAGFLTAAGTLLVIAAIVKRGGGRDPLGRVLRDREADEAAQADGDEEGSADG